MAVPEFYYFMRPALERLADGEPRHWHDVERYTMETLKLTPADLEERIPSGRKTRVADRVQWALTYLRHAGLIESAGRGINRITSVGKTYLAQAPTVITLNELDQFPGYREFKRRTASTGSVAPAQNHTAPPIATPQEAIDTAYKEHLDALAEELLERLKNVHPTRFEQIILDLMHKLGYGGTPDALRRLGKPGDEGIDGVINLDKLGLEKVYLQAKRWDNASIGSKDVQAFVGALIGHGASKGVFITTSTFTQQARDAANARAMQVRISLVSGRELARLMIDNDLGVATVQHYDIKRIDSDFYDE